MVAECFNTNSAKRPDCHQLRPSWTLRSSNGNGRLCSILCHRQRPHPRWKDLSPWACRVGDQGHVQDRTQALTLRRMLSTSTAPGARVTRRLLRTSTTRSAEDF